MKIPMMVLMILIYGPMTPIHNFYRYRVTHQAPQQLQAADLSIFAHFAALYNEVANKTSDCFANNFQQNGNLDCLPKPVPKDMFLTASGCYFYEVIICLISSIKEY